MANWMFRPALAHLFSRKSPFLQPAHRRSEIHPIEDIERLGADCRFEALSPMNQGIRKFLLIETSLFAKAGAVNAFRPRFSS
jgi:hypothetical protein